LIVMVVILGICFNVIYKLEVDLKKLEIEYPTINCDSIETNELLAEIDKKSAIFKTGQLYCFCENSLNDHGYEKMIGI
jgi:hypothetical protein